LLSAINQTYPNIEIILVDDCGHDNSMAIAQQTISTFDTRRICKIIKHSHNRGPSAGRNTGIKAATGDYILILDSDDLLPENAVDKLVAETKSKPDVVMGNSDDLQDGKIIAITGLTNKTFCHNEIFEEFVRNSFIVSPSNKLINREFFIKNDLFLNEKMMMVEDLLWFFTLTLNAKKLRTIADVTYHYRVNPNSLTQKPFAERLPAIIQGTIFMLQYVREKQINDSFVNSWLERLKGAKFLESIGVYNTQQQRELYRQFRDYRYVRKHSVFDLHYRLPEGLGFAVYRFFFNIQKLRRYVYYRYKI
jgi:glycosyltransferase involved in cell wall biosynthesis